MNIIEMDINEIHEYKNNPRHNENAVDYVAKSIEDFGFKVPIVVDKNNVIITGHTRRLAAMQLGLEKVPVIVADDLTPEQIREFRLADNKVAEYSEWDYEKLQAEIDEMSENIFKYGFEEISFDDDEMTKEDENPYTMKIEAPVYEVTGEMPRLMELYDDEKYQSLVSEIEKAKIPKDIKEFLKMAAYRHVVYDYANIAEFYAHASADIQELMENSALVIIDFEKAIEHGYATYKDAIGEGLRDEVEG